MLPAYDDVKVPLHDLPSGGRGAYLIIGRVKRIVGVAGSVVTVAVVVLVIAVAAAGSPPHAKVTAQNMSLIQKSLRTDGFRQFFGDPRQGNTVGCADHVLGSDHHGNRVYLYAACGEWRSPQCGSNDGANGSFPVVATVSRHSVIWQQPGDGPDYAPTIRRLFPRSLWGAALNPEHEAHLAGDAMRSAGCFSG